MNKKLVLWIFATALFFPFYAQAEGIAKNTAKMQAMDKITGRVSVIYVPVGGAVNFGSLSIAVRSCKTRPVEETPDNFVFADIADKTLQGENVNIFRGWMISSSPATHAVEHPIYDVWLLACVDKKVDSAQLLTSKQFAEREAYPKIGQSPTENKELSTETASPQLPEMKEDENHITDSQAMPPIEFSYDESEEISEEDTEIETEPEETPAEDTSESYPLPQ